MSQILLTTLAKVKEYLGITGTDQDDILNDLIETVSCEMEIYCNRQFELDVYIEQFIGNGEDTVRLPNVPIDSVLYAATGSSTGLTVTYTGSSDVGNVDVQDQRIVLTEGLTTTDINILESHTLTDVASSINSETNWTASASDSYAVYPGLALIQKRYDSLTENQSVSVTGSFLGIQMIKEADGFYRVPQMGHSVGDITHIYESTGSNSTDGAVPGRPTTVLPYKPLVDGPVYTVIYQGGYEAGSVPTSLEQLATQIVADAYKSINTQGNLKSERIGDYAYTNQSASNSSAVMSAIYAQSQRLDFYKEKYV